MFLAALIFLAFGEAWTEEGHNPAPYARFAGSFLFAFIPYGSLAIVLYVTARALSLLGRLSLRALLFSALLVSLAASLVASAWLAPHNIGGAVIFYFVLSLVISIPAVYFWWKEFNSTLMKDIHNEKQSSDRRTVIAEFSAVIIVGLCAVIMISWAVGLLR